MKIGPKPWHLKCSQGFIYDLNYWPSFWHKMTHIWTWPRYLSWWSFWASFMKIGPKLWPLECSQCFSMSWPPDLVFDQTWPIFEPDQDIVKIIILSQFYEDWTKTVASMVFTMFIYDLTYWPCFLTRHHPCSKLTEKLSRWEFWASLMTIGPKLWPPECSQCFLKIWPTDLVFDPT